MGLKTPQPWDLKLENFPLARTSHINTPFLSCFLTETRHRKLSLYELQCQINFNFGVGLRSIQKNYGNSNRSSGSLS